MDVKKGKNKTLSLKYDVGSVPTKQKTNEGFLLFCVFSFFLIFFCHYQTPQKKQISACFVVVWVFTCSIWIVLLIVLTMSGIMCTTFAVFFFAGWQVGPVEAVALSVVVGMSVDYCLHVAESYIDVTTYLEGKEERFFSRVAVMRKTMSLMALPLCNAACTTVLASAPLLFCQIKPLAQFGLVMVVSISLSLIFAIFCFAPLLMVVGPRPYKKTHLGRLIGFIVPVSIVSLVFGVLIGSGTISGPLGGDAL